MPLKKLKHPIELLERIWEQTDSGDTRCRYVSTGQVWAHIEPKSFSQPMCESYGKAHRYTEILKVLVRQRKPDFQRILWRGKNYQVVSPIYENYDHKTLSFLMKPLTHVREKTHE